MAKRPNGEGSIFPHRTGWGAYKWVTGPDGIRVRKYVYGKSHEEVNAKWVNMDIASFPEHDKVKFNDQELVLGFMGFLRDQAITDLTWQEVHELVLLWRGVDLVAYEAETAQMKAMFPRLWEKYGLLNEDKPEPRLRVTRKAEVPEQPVTPAPEGGLDFLLAKIRERP